MLYYSIPTNGGTITVNGVLTIVKLRDEIQPKTGDVSYYIS